MNSNDAHLHKLFERVKDIPLHRERLPRPCLTDDPRKNWLECDALRDLHSHFAFEFLLLGDFQNNELHTHEAEQLAGMAWHYFCEWRKTPEYAERQLEREQTLDPLHF